jgi:hypothetical protein
MRLTLSVIAGCFPVLQQLAAVAAAVQLPDDFRSSQGTNGLFYESYSDNRPSNTMNPGSGTVVQLPFVGSDSEINGSITITGETYQDPNGFPYLLDDALRSVLIMHPGTGGFNFGTGTSNLDASLRFVAPQAGVYHPAGAFARANDTEDAGDGVDVAIFKELNTGSPVFGTTIDAHHAVDANNYFGRDRCRGFCAECLLPQNESLRFVVFSDGQG